MTPTPLRRMLMAVQQREVTIRRIIILVVAAFELTLMAVIVACDGSRGVPPTPTITPTTHDILNSALVTPEELGSEWSRTTPTQAFTDQYSWCLISAANATEQSDFLVAVKSPGSLTSPRVRESIQRFDSGAAEQYMAQVRSGCARLDFKDEYFEQRGDHTIYLVHSYDIGTVRMLLIRTSDVLLKLSVLSNEPAEEGTFYRIASQAYEKYATAIQTLGTSAVAETSPTSGPSTTTDMLMGALLSPAEFGAGWTVQDQTTREDIQRVLTEPCQGYQATAIRAVAAHLKGEKTSSRAQYRPVWQETIAVLQPGEMSVYLQRLRDGCHAVADYIQLPSQSLGDDELHFVRTSFTCCSPLRKLVVVRLGSALLQVQYDEGDLHSIDDARFASLLNKAYEHFQTVIKQLPASGPSVRSNGAD